MQNQTAGLVVVSAFVVSAMTSQHAAAPDKEPPVLRMNAAPVPGVPETDGDCPALPDIKRVYGPVPPGAEVVVEMEMTGDEPVPLAFFEEALSQRAERYCCDGMSVLVAVAEPGARLFTEVKAKGWRTAPPEE